VERPILQECAHRLADEEGVAGGPLVDASRSVRVHGRLSHDRGQAGGLRFVEAAQVEMPDIGVCGPTGKRSGTRRRDHDQRMARTAFDDELDHADARRVEPLQVVDDDDARPGGGEQSIRVTGGDLRQR